MFVAGTRNVKVPPADVIHSFVVDEEGTIRVLNGAVGGKHCIVWLDNRSRDSGSWVDGEFELGFLAVIRAEPFQKESSKSRASSATKRVEDEEALERRAVI